jgi:alcohol dehydrogenase, propanol-preferring
VTRSEISASTEAFIDFTTTKDITAEIMRITMYGAHGVLITATTKEGYATAPSFFRPGVTMVAVGLPKDPTVLAGAPLVMLCLRKLNIVGSVVGTPKDVEEALGFTARGLVHVSRIYNHSEVYTDEVQQPILPKGKLSDLDHYCRLIFKRSCRDVLSFRSLELS